MKGKLKSCEDGATENKSKAEDAEQAKTKANNELEKAKTKLTGKAAERKARTAKLQTDLETAEDEAEQQQGRVEGLVRELAKTFLVLYVRWDTKEDMDPVVGWLVCVEGKDRGRDYRIHTERNFIGRSAAMDIAIAGDEAISRENHAVVSYNPKNHGFRLAPGDSRGMVYLNDEEVLSATVLAAYDLIELDASKLMFIPFCGECFTWPVDEK